MGNLKRMNRIVYRKFGHDTAAIEKITISAVLQRLGSTGQVEFGPGPFGFLSRETAKHFTERLQGSTDMPTLSTVGVERYGMVYSSTCYDLHCSKLELSRFGCDERRVGRLRAPS